MLQADDAVELGEGRHRTGEFDRNDAIAACLRPAGSGPRRFGQLRHDIPAISAKVLTGRLRDLEAKGVLWRRVMPTSPPSVEYGLTDLGTEFQPAIAAIVAIGHKLKQRQAAHVQSGDMAVAAS